LKKSMSWPVSGNINYWLELSWKLFHAPGEESGSVIFTLIVPDSLMA